MGRCSKGHDDDDDDDSVVILLFSRTRGNRVGETGKNCIRQFDGLTSTVPFPRHPTLPTNTSERRQHDDDADDKRGETSFFSDTKQENDLCSKLFMDGALVLDLESTKHSVKFIPS